MYMSRALELASKGRYSVAPNPMVGAVITYQDRIIGEGYHREFGQAHAEVNAINSVKDKALLKGATLYVSLEPCSHFGKTPPCAKRIIEEGIPKVVVASKDPSEKVAGKGIDQLIAAGITVNFGILEKEAIRLNRRFHTFHREKRPFILLKWAESKDGFMGRKTDDPEKADSWITNPLSKQLVHQWRAEEMGILVGRGTAETDDPELSCREYAGENPIRFLIDPQLKIKSTAKIFNDVAQTVILNQKINREEGNRHYLKFDKKEDLFQLLFEHCLKNDIHSIMVEGGAATLQSFIDAGFWDEARVFKGQKSFGGGIRPPQIKASLAKKEMIREDLLLTYQNITA